MKLKFKVQDYQTAAVAAVVDCFAGQPGASSAAQRYRMDPGNTMAGMDIEGFKNTDITLSETA